MAEELNRRREECIQLRTMLSNSAISAHSVRKESYGGEPDLVNEDGELEIAYKTQKDLNRYAMHAGSNDYRTFSEI